MITNICLHYVGRMARMNIYASGGIKGIKDAMTRYPELQTRGSAWGAKFYLSNNHKN